MRGLMAVLLLALAAPLQAQALMDFTPAERARIAAHGPWPQAVAADASNRADRRPAAVAFGRMLFFERGLSADGSLSCASCHRPETAFQDGRHVAQGGRTGPRNTPSLLDAAQRRWLGWDGAHDSLWSASLAPLLAVGEQGQTVAGLAAWVRAQPARGRLWRAALGSAPPPDDDTAVAVGLAKALAAYQATLVSPRTPFDDFRDALLQGDRRAAARYPLAAQRGLRLFIGSARCHVCHAGPAFSNGEFADIGVSFFVDGGVDAGRHGGLARLQASPMSRLGPHNDAGVADPRATTTRHVVALHRHFGEFRVPGLRQLVHTAPYMHDGSVATIEDVVRHYSELNEERLHADGERILRRLDLGTEQAADLAAFLRSLSAASLPRRQRPAASRPGRGSARWPRRRDQRCGSVRCRTGASGCARRTRPAAGSWGRPRCVRRVGSCADPCAAPQAHRRSSKGVSVPAPRRRPSASGFMKRMDTISLWPLISGTRPVSGAMRTRSSW
jgi:cytochrome c peroxidase